LQFESLGTANRGPLGAAYARALQAERELERVKAGPTTYQIEQAEIAVRQAEIQLEEATTAYQRMTLVAPFDGIVSRLDVEVGSLVAPGVPVLEITNISPLHVMVEVDEVDIRQVREGMPARVRLDALSNVALAGEIEEIAVLGSDQDGIVSYDVKVRLEETDLRARNGMTAEAAVIVEERRDVLVVPNRFVRVDRRNDQAFVNVVEDDGMLKEVEIQLGLQGQDNSEVIAGIQPGDVIALDLAGGSFSFFGG
jgi:RND family efflux transporter MFP subunit